MRGGRGEDYRMLFLSQLFKATGLSHLRGGGFGEGRPKREGRARYTRSNKNTGCVHVWVYVWTLHSQFLKCWTLSCPEKLSNCHSKTESKHCVGEWSVHIIITRPPGALRGSTH